MKTIKIDASTVVLNFGAEQPQWRVCEEACLVLFGNRAGVEEDTSGDDGDHGFFLSGNRMNYWHVKSVDPGIYVGSTSHLTPETTRELAWRIKDKE